MMSSSSTAPTSSSASVISTSELDAQLSQAKIQVDDFVDTQMRHLDAAMDEYVQKLQSLDGQTRLLQQEKDAATSRVDDLRSQVTREQQMLSDQQTELNRLKGDVTRAPATVSAAKTQAAAIEAQLHEAQEALEKSQKESEYALAELTKGISYYQRLGLSFERIEDERLRVKFTQIDPSSPQRIFMFCVHVTEADQYQISDCEPQIESTAELVEQLNRTNNFSHFVQQMRKRFRALVGRL